MNRSPLPSTHTPHPLSQQISTSGYGASPIHLHPPNERQNPTGDEKGFDLKGDEDEESSGDQEGTETGGQVDHPFGACAQCKRLKMRCVFDYRRSPACKRCIMANRECTIPQRRPKTLPEREELIRTIRDKDALIGLLIEQLEASTSTITPVSVTLNSHSTKSADSFHPKLRPEAARVRKSATVADSIANESTRRANLDLQRRKEIQKWLKKARARIGKSSVIRIERWGGESNAVLWDEVVEEVDRAVDLEDGSTSEGEVDSVSSPAHTQNHTTSAPGSIMSSTGTAVNSESEFGRRRRGACVSCRDGRERCVFPSPEATICMRCVRSGITCLQPGPEIRIRNSRSARRIPRRDSIVSTIQEEDEYENRIEQLLQLIQTLADELERRAFPSFTSNTDDDSSTPFTQTDEELRQLIGQARGTIGISRFPQSSGNPSPDYQVAESPGAPHQIPSTDHPTMSRVVSPVVHSSGVQDGHDGPEAKEWDGMDI